MAWVVCMAIDYLTGSAAACKAGKWSSALAREGLWHKAGCVAAVTISGILDLVVGHILGSVPEAALPFAYTVFLCPLVVVWYILTEVGSIVENAGAMGAPVPGLAQADGQGPAGPGGPETWGLNRLCLSARGVVSSGKRRGALKWTWGWNRSGATGFGPTIWTGSCRRGARRRPRGPAACRTPRRGLGDGPLQPGGGLHAGGAAKHPV